MELERDLIGLQIEDIQNLGPGFKKIVFADGHTISYKPGQFLVVVDQPGPHALRRSYSILSDPGGNEKLSIGVRRIDNGYFSRILTDRVAPGDIVFTTGAAGRFLLPAATDIQTLYFFAAGSGIVPILSLLKAALREKRADRILLIYSIHSHRTVPFETELLNLKEKDPGILSLHFHYSDARDIRQARLTRESILAMLGTNQAAHQHDYFYTCGPISYMRRVIFVLREFGIPIERIRKEEFVVQKFSFHDRKPPDLQPHPVTIISSNRTYHFSSGYPHTILRAGIKAGLPMPFSCETGKCGSCAARCLSGSVWMSDNEVLTPADIENGLVLTCTGYPLGGAVVLSFE